MKRKAFTLVELLATIVIIGILSLIIAPVVTNSIKESRETLFEVQKTNILSATRIWVADHLADLPDTDGQSITITLTELKDGGYIDEQLTDPKTGELFLDSEVSIIILYANEKYTYQIQIPE